MGANQPLTLRDWLETATLGIASWDKDRIEREIRAHYEDAVAECLAQGLHQEAAERVALESLGSAKKARRENRKTCSSAGTEGILSTLVERHPKKGSFVWGGEHWATALLFITLCAGYIMAAYYEDQSYARISDMLAISIVPMWYLLFIATPDFVDRNKLKKAYIARLSASLSMMTGGMLPGLFEFGITWNILTYIWFFSLLTYCFVFQKELRKIPKNLSRDDLLKG